jgi:hypothetical protein
MFGWLGLSFLAALFLGSLIGQRSSEELNPVRAIRRPTHTRLLPTHLFN